MGERDEGGMMILVGAILLIVAFLALAVIMSRLGNVPRAAALELDDFTTAEADTVARGIQSAANGLTGNANFCTGMNAALDDIARHEASRGFVVSYAKLATCAYAARPATFAFTLTDGRTELTRTVDLP